VPGARALPLTSKALIALLAHGFPIRCGAVPELTGCPLGAYTLVAVLWQSKQARVASVPVTCWNREEEQEVEIAVSDGSPTSDLRQPSRCEGLRSSPPRWRSHPPGVKPIEY
jgi:hypothetical protein